MADLNLPEPDWMDEELVMLQDMAADFYQTECAPHYEHFEEKGMFDSEVWLKAGQMGLLGAEIPESYGGPGGNFAHDAVIAIEANKAGIDVLARRCTMPS